MKRPLKNLEVYNYPHRQTENLYRLRKQAESWSVFDRCKSSSDRIWENVLKSCAMRAKKKKSGKNGENEMVNSAKQSLQHETPPD